MAVDLPSAMTLAVDLDRIARDMPSRYANPAGYDTAFTALRRAVACADPRGAVTDNWDSAIVRACGIRATCTLGIRGAVMNWIRQVEQKSGLPLGRDPATNIGEQR